MITLDIRKPNKQKQVVTTEDSVYIQMGDYTYYFDNSEGSNTVQRWLSSECKTGCPMEEPTWNSDSDIFESKGVWPLHPNVVYKNEGWASWGETLGVKK